jgi:hypothetical protein
MASASSHIADPGFHDSDLSDDLEQPVKLRKTWFTIRMQDKKYMGLSD